MPGTLPTSPVPTPVTLTPSLPLAPAALRFSPASRRAGMPGQAELPGTAFLTIARQCAAETRTQCETPSILTIIQPGMGCRLLFQTGRAGPSGHCKSLGEHGVHTLLTAQPAGGARVLGGRAGPGLAVACAVLYNKTLTFQTRTDFCEAWNRTGKQLCILINLQLKQHKEFLICQISF